MNVGQLKQLLVEWAVPDDAEVEMEIYDDRIIEGADTVPVAAVTMHRSSDGPMSLLIKLPPTRA